MPVKFLIISVFFYICKKSNIFFLNFRVFPMNYIPSEEENLFALDTDIFFPGLSVDCVILGFHNRDLKILLNKFSYIDNWMLPGGFVYKEEDVDASAYRVLSSRTGLKNTYLRQFYTFGDCSRTKMEENTRIVEKNVDEYAENHWFLQRFISVAYYALVEYSKVEVFVEDKFDKTKWFPINEIPELYGDHNKIVEKALQTLRQQLDYIPIGYELLPEKFTLSELRSIYETLLNKVLDRRNFQRKILSLDIIDKLDQIRKTWGKRPTTLYTFNKERYAEAVKNGISFVNW